MNLKEFQLSASRTIPSQMDQVAQVDRMQQGLAFADIPVDLVINGQSPLINGTHALMGFVDELSELNMAINKMDLTNVREELGDFFWYLQLACYAHTIPMQNLDKYVCTFNGVEHTAQELVEDLMHHIGLYASLLKKTTFYGKDADNPSHILAQIYYALAYICVYYEFELHEILQENQDKLKARYPEKFTEQDAIERKDKEDGQ